MTPAPASGLTTGPSPAGPSGSRDRRRRCGHRPRPPLRPMSGREGGEDARQRNRQRRHRRRLHDHRDGARSGNLVQRHAGRSAPSERPTVPAEQRVHLDPRRDERRQVHAHSARPDRSSCIAPSATSRSAGTRTITLSTPTDAADCGKGLITNPVRITGDGDINATNNSDTGSLTVVCGAIRIDKNSIKGGAVKNAGAVFSVAGPVAGTEDDFSVTDDITAAAPDEDAAIGQVCVSGLVIGATYTVNETSPPTGYGAASQSNVPVVAKAGSCSTADLNVATFVNPPLADIQVLFRDGGSAEVFLDAARDHVQQRDRRPRRPRTRPVGTTPCWSRTSRSPRRRSPSSARSSSTRRHQAQPALANPTRGGSPAWRPSSYRLRLSSPAWWVPRTSLPVSSRAARSARACHCRGPSCWPSPAAPTRWPCCMARPAWSRPMPAAGS